MSLDEKIEHLDPETQKFILWTFEQLKADAELTRMIESSVAETREWLLENLEGLREALLEKMIKGGKEHGPPIHTPERLQKEIEGERIDLIGWGMVERYNKERL